MKPTILAAMAAVMLPAAAFAHDEPPVITDAFVRSANPASGAAFMTIHNPRHVDCTLVGASTSDAERAELHTNKDDGGVMTMRKVDALTLPAEGDLILQRGGDHLMLLGLAKPLQNGAVVHLTLDFGPCGKVEAEMPVDSTRAEVQPAGAMPAMDHTAH